MDHQKDENLFRLKSKSPNSAYVIYKDVSTCKENYINEAKGKVDIRWEEHNRH